MDAPYRLALDLGSNSIGWCAVALQVRGRSSDGRALYEPARVLDAGVRVLTPNEEAGRDPQSKTSLARQRGDARAARRRRDRFLRRQKRLMQVLVEAGLMPEDTTARKRLERLDPYWLRAAALAQPLHPHELGRAIFHLNQRRGFKSNRIADSDDAESSAMKQGIRALNEALEASDARTLGEFLARRHARDKHGCRTRDAAPQPVRFRPTSEGTKTLYDLYPARDLIAAELAEIWRAQAPHHPQLTDNLFRHIQRIVIEQRPLKSPAVGRCSLRPEAGVEERHGLEIDQGERAPKAHPLFQRFRILQDLAQLRVTAPGARERCLTLPERDALAAKLMSTSASTVKFEDLRKAAKLPGSVRFNSELAGRKGLPPDQTAAKLAAKTAFGPQWRRLSRDLQIETVERLLGVEDPEVLIDWLVVTLDLDRDRAQKISGVRLPQGHGRFGRAVLAELVAAMEQDSREDAVDPSTGELYPRPLEYFEAVQAIGEHHSDRRPESRASRLPYYGEVLARHVVARPDAPEGSQERIGRVTNPTVHIALNQTRKIVNALIERYGPPAEIVIELGRELKLNRERKEQLQRDNRENEKRNDRFRAELAELGYPDTPRNMLLLRLFEELPADERVCVFSGTPLSKEKLFDGSVEIEHVLPFSRTLDDGFMNKVLCTREANRRKGNRAPGEAWGGDALRQIVERAERLFPRKAWRFQPDAMARFEAEGGFQARQLTDTQYMSRLAKTYLEQVCDQVWAPPGRLTAMLRGKWGLNGLLPDHNFTDPRKPKNRKDHRHHAIDAFVVACTDRGLLNRIAQASGKAEQLDLDRLFPKDGFPEPYDGFRDDLQRQLDRIVVSHKPDHGLPPGAQDDVHVTSGQLHEATAYGPVDEEIDGKRYNLVTRKPIDQLRPAEVARIRDRRLREALAQALDDAAAHEGPLSDARRRELLSGYGRDHGIRRVRVLKTTESVRTIRHTDQAGRTFEKAYTPGDNHRVEIYARPDGTWAGEGVTVHDANQPGYKPAWTAREPHARLVMRVHGGDLIRADFGDGRKVYRVYRLEPSNNRLRLVPHNEAGSIDQRHNDSNDPLRWTLASFNRLRAATAERVRVDVLGRVRPARDAAS